MFLTIERVEYSGELRYERMACQRFTQTRNRLNGGEKRLCESDVSICRGESFSSGPVINGVIARRYEKTSTRPLANLVFLLPASVQEVQQ